ncbi:MAG: PmbA/TldA family metallopeptidase, partial [Acidimicrobiales bacterium]
MSDAVSMTDDSARPGHEVALAALSVAGGGPRSPERRIAVVEDSHEAEVRFANNTITTNGLRRSRQVSVISLRDKAAGTAAGSASASGPGGDGLLETIVELARSDADGAAAATDESQLIAPGDEEAAQPSEPFEDPAAETSLGSLTELIGRLGEALSRSAGDGRALAGFVHHEIRTTWLASSTGIALRHT